MQYLRGVRNKEKTSKKVVTMVVVGGGTTIDAWAQETQTETDKKCMLKKIKSLIFCM